MRKVYGIGETVYDILFRNGKPVDAVPGGSVFNGLVSLGRCGAHSTFITEIGDDQVGQTILSFMNENGIDGSYASCYKGHKTAISLAYLDNNGDAHYSFYKDYPNNRLDFDMPPIGKDDVVAFGAYFALNPVLHDKVHGFLECAKDRGAILYYDLNFRDNHKHEAAQLLDTFRANYGMADIVRASHEDLSNAYGTADCHQVWEHEIRPYCKRFICTKGKNGVNVFDSAGTFSYSSKQIEPVSTVGAGDNFNAGIIYGLLKENITKDRLCDMDKSVWDRLTAYAIDFGTEACMSTQNYISRQFALKYSL